MGRFKPAWWIHFIMERSKYRTGPDWTAQWNRGWRVLFPFKHNLYSRKDHINIHTQSFVRLTQMGKSWAAMVKELSEWLRRETDKIRKFTVDVLSQMYNISESLGSSNADMYRGVKMWTQKLQNDGFIVALWRSHATYSSLLDCFSDTLTLLTLYECKAVHVNEVITDPVGF